MEILAGTNDESLLTNELHGLKNLVDKCKIVLPPEYVNIAKLKYYISIGHFIYLNRFSAIKMFNEEYHFMPQGKINPNGYAFLWLPHIDKENFDEYKSRAIVYRTMKIISQLNAKSPKGWIIDLRNNTGGIVEYFTAAICQIIDEFELVGYDKKGEPNSRIVATKDNFKLEIENEIVVSVDYPFRVKINFKNLYVLINENTASAAEVLAILLKKYKGAKICGNESYGIVSLMQSTTYHECTFIYPISKILFDNGADKIIPDIKGVPKYLYPN